MKFTKVGVHIKIYTGHLRRYSIHYRRVKIGVVVSQVENNSRVDRNFTFYSLVNFKPPRATAAITRPHPKEEGKDKKYYQNTNT